MEKFCFLVDFFDLLREPNNSFSQKNVVVVFLWHASQKELAVVICNIYENLSLFCYCWFYCCLIYYSKLNECYRFIMEIVKYILLCDIIHKEIFLLYFHHFFDKKTTTQDNFCQNHKTRWFTSMYFSFLLDILLWPVLFECKMDFYWAKLDWLNAYFFSFHIHLACVMMLNEIIFHL